MKKIITLILIAASFNFAMTLAESRSKVNHCYTRFEKVINELKNCKAPTDNDNRGSLWSSIFECSNGEFIIGGTLKTASVKTDNVEVAIKYENGYGTPRYCMQTTKDEYGVVIAEEKLYYYNDDASQAYNYFKANVKIKKVKTK